MTKRVNHPHLDLCLQSPPPFVDLSNLDCLVEILFPILSVFKSLKDVFSFVSLSKRLYQKWIGNSAERLTVFRNIFTRSSDLSRIEFHGVHFLRISQSELAIMVEYAYSEVVNVLKKCRYCDRMEQVLDDEKQYRMVNKTYAEIWTNVEEMLEKNDNIVKFLLSGEGFSTPIIENIMTLVCLKIRIHYSIELSLYKRDDDYYAIYSNEGVDPDDIICFIPIGMTVSSNSRNCFVLDIGQERAKK